MKHIVSNLLFLVIVGGAIAGEAVVTSLSASPPEGEFIFSFDSNLAAEGWGWIRSESERRDVGMSFPCKQDATVGKISLKIQEVPVSFRENAPFLLQIFATRSLEENPAEGREVYAGRGELNLSQGDRDSWLTFHLGTAATLSAGEVYTFVLSWESENDANFIVFLVDKQYHDGLLWYRDPTVGPSLQPVKDTQRPGMLVYIH